MEIQVSELTYAAPATTGVACRDRCAKRLCGANRSRRSVSSRVTILHDMSFTIRSGRTTTVIGPSGSGKTTLLRLLARHLSPSSGAVTVSAKGVEIHSTVPIAFVGMEDVHHQSLTPYETVEFSVRFANPSITNTDLDQLTVTKLEVMDLKSCAHAPLSTLSTGERMRLRIATALATEPRVLILDNVLSCLNTAEQLRVMELVKPISAGGYTVVMGINQLPKAIEQHIEDVVLLARGRVLYAGPRDACQDYFKQMINLDVKPDAFLGDMITNLVSSMRSEMITIEAAVEEIKQMIKLDVKHDTFLDDMITNLVSSTRSEMTTIEAAVEETGEEPDGSIGLDDTRGQPVLRLTESSDDVKSDKVTGWKTGQLAERWRVDNHRKMRAKARAPVAEEAPSVDLSLLDASLKRPAVFTQMVMLLQRFWRASTRDRSDLPNMLLGLVVCAVFVRVLGGDQVREQLQATFQISAFVFSTLFISVILPHAKVSDWLEFRALYEHEQSHDEYSPTVYFFAHSLYSLFEMTLMCGLFTIIASGVFLKSATMLAVFYFFVYLTAHACAHSALLESIVFTVGQNGRSHILGMILACYSFLFAGFVVPRAQMPTGLTFLYSLSYTQYAWSGIMDMALPQHDLPDQIFGYPHRPILNALMLSVFIASLCRIGFVFVLAWMGYKRQLRVKRN